MPQALRRSCHCALSLSSVTCLPPPTHPHPTPPTRLPALQDGLFEEATLLRQRELELKGRLSGPPEEAPVVPVVGVEHIEQVGWAG